MNACVALAVSCVLLCTVFAVPKKGHGYGGGGYGGGYGGYGGYGGSYGGGDGYVGGYGGGYGGGGYGGGGYGGGFGGGYGGYGWGGKKPTMRAQCKCVPKCGKFQKYVGRCPWCKKGCKLVFCCRRKWP
ncbi:hypothetical protein DPMN_073507 [Dreissena polymorpha]|uniref:Uncharacterized protein n=1 Tax=Dreissena polymorpha TaxID=45954 RepID=A0A9D4BZ97_DREPO|nr:hypothetical protein DPMN_073507 [Dreissena polymorpha]